MADAFAVPAFGSTGLAGWDQTASVNQNDRSAATATQRGNLDSGLLSHLSRALYIPRHDGETAHMAIHDISAQYAAATHSLSIGSPLYTAALGVMGKPRSGDGIPVLYDVEANNGGDGEAGLVVAPVRDQESSSQMDNVELTVCTAEDKAGTLTTRTNNTEIPLPVPLSISYPIPPSSTRVGTFKHPYFAFRIPAPDAGSIAVEWQIHPIQQGRMRYTLVRCPAQQQQDDILAVYYHIGVEASLSLPYSEGVLLVPGSQGSAGDSGAIVVASALGMLWRLRELHGTDGKSGKRNEKKPPRLGSIKGLFGRKE